MVCICIMFLPIHVNVLFAGMTVDNICAALIVLVTVYSGVEYFVVNRRALKFKH